MDSKGLSYSERKRMNVRAMIAKNKWHEYPAKKEYDDDYYSW